MPIGISSIVTWIADSTVGVMVVLLAGRLLLQFVKNPAARQRVGEWTLAGCLLVAVVGCVPGIPKLSLGLLDPIATGVFKPGLNEPGPDVGIVRTAEHGGNTDKNSSVSSGVIATANEPARSWPHWKMPASWWVVLAAVYAMGISVMLGRLMVGHLLLRHLVRKACRPGEEIETLWAHCRVGQVRGARLLVSDVIRRPAAAGVFHPVVLIPSHLCKPECRQQLRAVLLHELGHIRRLDTVMWTAVSVLQVLFFHQPLFWLLRRDLRLAQEHIADGYAARRVGSAETYAEYLMQVLRADSRPTLGLLPILSAIRHPSDFYRRMERLIRAGEDVAPQCTWGFTLTTGLVLALLATSAAAFTLRSALPTQMSAMAMQGPAVDISAPAVRAPDVLEQRGIQYLLEQQDSAGGWLSRTGPGVTALTLKALLQNGIPQDQTAVRRALNFIESFHQADGGYYRDVAPAYNTAIVLSTLALLPGDGYKTRIAGARQFLQAAQVPSQPNPSNGFYAAAKDPQSLYDTSSTIEAFRASGLHASDPAVQNSLHNMVTSGFTLDRNERNDDAVLANYGAITYAGLKSMLYAGLHKDDPRVRALVNCIQTNYTLDSNPGERSARGQFYYYHVFAQALHAYGDDVIVDSHGISHDWRQELHDRLATLQGPDGSWVNRKLDTWLEGDPVLVTTYSVLALQETRK